MFIFIYCFLIICKILEASFCGKNELPYSFEVTKTNDFILKCAVPPCLNLFKPPLSINGRHLSGMRLFGFNKKMNETNLDICEKNTISTKCVGDGEWIGGIEAETENSNKLILLCCKHDAAKTAKFLDTFDLEKEEIVKAGSVKINGRVKAFDYISNVVKYIDGYNNIVYKVFVNRLPCSGNTLPKKRRTGTSKLFQVITLRGNDGGSLQEISGDDDDVHIAEYNGDGGTTSIELDDCLGNNNTGMSDEESDRAGPLPFPRMPRFEPSLRLYQAPLLINQIPRSHLSRLYQAPIVSADDDSDSSDSSEDDTDMNNNNNNNNQNQDPPDSDDSDTGNNRVQLDGCATPPPSNQNPSPPNNPNNPNNPMPPQQNPVTPPTPPNTPMPPPPPMQCFSGDTIVTTLNYSKKRLDELKIDEWILSAGDERIGFNKVISWLHRMPNLKAEFIKFTLDNGKTLKITKKHFIYKIDCSANETLDFTYTSTQAENILPTDCLLSMENENSTFVPTRISKIELIHEKGIYAPLTNSGDIIVNGIYASCYSEIDNEFLVLKLPIINQFFKQIFEYLRMAFFDLIQSNSRIDNEIDLFPGIQNAVDLVKTML